MKAWAYLGFVLTVCMHMTGFSQCWRPEVTERFEFYEPFFEDFDNDGKTDVLIPNISRNDFTVYRFENGNYIPFSRVDMSEGSPFIYGNKSLINVDNDGIPDLVDVYFTDRIQVSRRSHKGLIFDTIQVTVPGLAESGVWADTDNDGDEDFFFPKANNPYLYRYKFNGTGFFVSDSVLTSSSSGPLQLGTCDFNADGVKDVVCYSDGSNPELRVLIDNGSGFNTITDTIGAELDGFFLSADMNNDGYEDIVNIYTSIDKRINIIRNDSGVGFTTFTFPEVYSDNLARAAVVDFNADQLQDIVVLRFDSLFVLMGDGQMGISNVVSVKRTWLSGNNISISDINADGIMDIVFSNADEFEVYFGNSSGQLSQWAGWGSWNSTNDFDFTFQYDIDSDGLKDIISSSSDVLYIKQYAPGKFYLPKTLRNYFPNEVVAGIGDFNFDGKADLVTTGFQILKVWSDINDFTQAPVLSFSRTFQNILNVEVLKLNSGPFDDLLVICQNPQFGSGDTVRTFTGNSSSMLSSHQNFLLPFKRGEYVLGDLTSDGYPDLIVMDSYGFDMISYKGNLSGLFTPAFSFSLDNGQDIAYGNLNSTGNPEVIISDFNAALNDGRFDIYTVTSTMDLVYQNSILTPLKQYGEIETIDLNNDGDLDIYGGDASTGLNRIYLGNGNFNSFIEDTLFQGPVDFCFEPLYTDSLTGKAIYNISSSSDLGQMSQFAPRITSNISSTNYPCNSQLVTLRCDSRSNSTYLWSNGSTSPWITVTGDGSYSCQVTHPSTSCTYATDTITLNFVNCDSVWPGDANHDLLVDLNDLFPIAANFNDSGLTRASVSNAWAAWHSTDWNTYYNFTDEKFVDCNGDGAINHLDTVAIQQNYSLTYSARPSVTPVSLMVQPEFTLEIIKPGVNAGDTIVMGLRAGFPNVDLSGITGLYFDLNIDMSNFSTGSMEFEFSDQNFLGQSGTEWIALSRKDNGNLKAVISRYNLSAVDGNGVIGELRLILNQTMTLPYFLDYSFADCGFVNGVGELVSLNSSSDSLNITNVGINDPYVQSALHLGPNPVQSDEEIRLWLNNGADVLSYEWIGLNGQTHTAGRVDKAAQGEIRLKSPSSGGVYFLRIITTKEVFITKVFIN